VAAKFQSVAMDGQGGQAIGDDEREIERTGTGFEVLAG